ncbi:hypothetical protein GVM20_00550 [Porphyrobacter sp. SLTP]|uniref:hypothetical protein n=1 Tax=Porphyrobacter sp. SLTP TaxID=2683266 RepID=UPI001412F9D6|nr:hypothetical protein [Porphyrobacter sp. SLTP]NBB23612.1 hypothetical protein [Porphyrobacter sp. SLTP]
MEVREKHWLNPNFLAPNVLEVEIDPATFSAAFGLVPEIQSVEAGSRELALGGGLRFSVKSMASLWASDILWISQDDMATYNFFNAMFRASGIAEKVAHRVDHDHDLRLYSGFFVTRSKCEKPDFHEDWLEANNDAFTFLMPLTANCGEVGLTYANARGGVAHYAYQMGKGLIFGDHFVHATAAGQTSQRCVLLSFTFGTDRMDNWPRIAETAAAQGRLHCRPDGVVMRGDKVVGTV